MANCRFEGCDQTARPLSRFCERHIAMGPRESTIRSGDAHPMRKAKGRIAKKSALKPMRMKRAATVKMKSSVKRKATRPARRSK
jgi:hypothetical protein